MGIYDLIVLGVILLTSLLGWRKGLATQVASIVSIVASFVVAVRFREPVAARIDAAEPWNRFAAMLILYLGTSLVIWLIFRQVRTSIERLKLREFDRQMGAVFGALKGIALASVGTLFAFTLLEEPQRQGIIHSRSGVWIAKLLNNSTAIMPPGGPAVPGTLPGAAGGGVRNAWHGRTAGSPYPPRRHAVRALGSTAGPPPTCRRDRRAATSRRTTSSEPATIGGPAIRGPHRGRR